MTTPVEPLEHGPQAVHDTFVLRHQQHHEAIGVPISDLDDCEKMSCGADETVGTVTSPGVQIDKDDAVATNIVITIVMEAAGTEPGSSSSSSSRNNPSDAAVAVAAAATELDLRLIDFQSARMQRRSATGVASPLGMIGLCQHVAEIRTDLAWARTKASDRKRHNEEPTSLSWADHVDAHAKNVPIPFVSYALVAIFTGLLACGFYQSHGAFAALAVNPSFGPAHDPLRNWGGLEAVKIIEEEQWYRLFTALFFHGGIVHYFGNVVATVYVGPVLERAHGSGRVGLTFCLAGAAANLLSATYAPFSVSVGASGGICAWLGLCVVDGVTHWPLLQIVYHADDDVIGFPFRLVKICIVAEILLLILVGLLPWIDNFAHLGGFVFGIAVSMTVLRPSGGEHFFGSRAGLARRYLKQKLYSAVLFLAALLCVTNVLWLYHSQDVGDLPCRHCRYLSCAPLPAFAKYCDPCYHLRDAYTKSALDGNVEIELHCPYGEFAFFIEPSAPTTPGGWAGLCHDYCDQ